MPPVYRRHVMCSVNQSAACLCVCLLYALIKMMASILEGQSYLLHYLFFVTGYFAFQHNQHVEMNILRAIFKLKERGHHEHVLTKHCFMLNSVKPIEMKKNHLLICHICS